MEIDLNNVPQTVMLLLCYSILRTSLLKVPNPSQPKQRGFIDGQYWTIAQLFHCYCIIALLTSQASFVELARVSWLLTIIQCHIHSTSLWIGLPKSVFTSNEVECYFPSLGVISKLGEKEWPECKVYKYTCMLICQISFTSCLRFFAFVHTSLLCTLTGMLLLFQFLVWVLVYVV